MRALASQYFGRHPELRFAILAPRDNVRQLELAPFGVQAEVLEAESNPDLCEQYFRLNHHAFGKLPLPRWVLSDLYLLPGAIGLVLGPPTAMEPAARMAAGIGESAPRAILSAYVGAPSIVPGQLIGVSLMGFARGLGVGAWTKVLTLKALRATSVRGVAQWDNPSVRVHTRLGALRVVGRVPGGHELSGSSFVYDCDLRDEEALARAMTREVALPVRRRVPARDVAELSRVLERAEKGERIIVAPPGLDEEHHVLFAE